MAKASKFITPTVADLLWRDRIQKENHQETTWSSKFGWMIDNYKKLNELEGRIKPRRWQTRSYQKECYAATHEDARLPQIGTNKLINNDTATYPRYPATTAQIIGWLSKPEFKLEKYGNRARPKNSILRQLNWPWEAVG